VKSRLRNKLQGGDFVKVVGINRVTEPWLTELVGELGFDVVWFDMEHRAHGFEVIDRLSLACRATGIDLMVRICKDGYASAMRTLEFGAHGIMVPHCCSPEEARQWAEWTRFPPQGKRGFDHAGADAKYGLCDPAEYLRTQNREVFLVVQIEDREAVDRVDAIAAVEGIDLLFVGPADLTMSYGVPLERDHPTIQRAFDKVASAAEKAGKWWGTVTDTPEMAQRELDRGARMVTCANDHFLLVRGLEAAYRDFQKIGIHKGESEDRKADHAGLSRS
jgi:2-keto-3-deoxy-L-rhamnonate aldolase RhmA